MWRESGRRLVYRCDHLPSKRELEREMRQRQRRWQATARVPLVGDRVEIPTRRSGWIVTAERRLVVRITAGTHLTAGRHALVSGTWVRCVPRLTAGRSSARTDSQHVRLVTGGKLLADSLTILQHCQSRRSSLHRNAEQHHTPATIDRVVLTPLQKSMPAN